MLAYLLLTCFIILHFIFWVGRWKWHLIQTVAGSAATTMAWKGYTNTALVWIEWDCYTYMVLIIHKIDNLLGSLLTLPPQRKGQDFRLRNHHSKISSLLSSFPTLSFCLSPSVQIKRKWESLIVIPLCLSAGAMMG